MGSRVQRVNHVNLTVRYFLRAAILAVSVCIAGAATAQFRRGFSGVHLGTASGRGASGTTDSPRADINMSIRLSDLTRTKVSFDPSGQPNHLLVRATSDELFQCPFLIMAAPGSALFNSEEAARLREYVLKGGFLWADDFWGSFPWEQWVQQLRK